MTVALPEDWARQVATYPADGGPTGQEWLDTVPALVTRTLHRWELEVDGPVRTGWTALVVPVRRGTERLALKVVWPHPEAALEHLALRDWGAAGAVRLVAADPGSGALLLERLDADRDLRTIDVEPACAVVGDLLARLHRPAGPMYLRLADYLLPHLDRMQDRPRIPRRIVQHTRALGAELLAGPEPDRLLHTDLHYENVLAGPDGSWVAIDPKPLAGHPGFELYPLLDNRIDDLDGLPFRSAMRRRLTIGAEAMGLDLDAAFAWTLLRAGIETSWASEMDIDGRRLTHAIALTKALAD